MTLTSHQPVTLHQVAEAAGVSVSTASRALNGRAKTYRISERAVENVQREAQRLGFRPSLLARSLQSQRSGLMGVVVPDVSNPFFAAIAREVTLQAETQGMSVLLADSRETTSVETKLVDELRARRVEALVVCPVGTESQHLMDADDAGIPLVVIDRCFPETSMTSVLSDNVGGARRGLQQLLNHGHTEIGCLQGLPGTLPNQQRLTTIRQTMEEAGLTFADSLLAGDNFTEQSGYESTLQLLTSHPEISALFAFSTPNAFGALRAAEELGRSVPDDLSVVTFDDSPFADFMRVPLSTVSQDVERLGRTAAEVILKQLRTGKKPRKRTHTIPVKLIPRHSIAKVQS
ncbi:LacI family DNA-binding transcriptional regulator [Allorhodopirellula solitaria]|uniref:HTH-type transcriptional regulator DegA n=1 Tax=Allorhodopirellula solitaria TaxID=2527987 RepID=A0A5C5X2D4_9BACT|nr:LacI family DNA-binding transcriptional regulator [Allorhodopirellula solitaria]TWT56392.1 HTH-type transcriptional regulator DegA [Allorhodopirellula solitaria]